MSLLRPAETTIAAITKPLKNPIPWCMRGLPSETNIRNEKIIRNQLI